MNEKKVSNDVFIISLVFSLGIVAWGIFQPMPLLCYYINKMGLKDNNGYIYTTYASILYPA